MSAVRISHDCITVAILIIEIISFHDKVYGRRKCLEHCLFVSADGDHVQAGDELAGLGDDFKLRHRPSWSSSLKRYNPSTAPLSQYRKSLYHRSASSSGIP